MIISPYQSPLLSPERNRELGGGYVYIVGERHAQVWFAHLDVLVAPADEHADHGRGTYEYGPEDPDCPCRATENQSDCALAGCGFCVPASRCPEEKDVAKEQNGVARRAEEVVRIWYDVQPGGAKISLMKAAMDRLRDALQQKET